jgi:hypothetical protein
MMRFVLPLLLLLPAPAFAVDGLESLGLTWGMSFDEVRTTFPSLALDPKAEGGPRDATMPRAILPTDVEMFGARLEVSLYFDVSGLSVIRLQYRNPEPGNEQKIVEWYQPHWGDPLQTTERDRGRTKRSWAWPWEGVEIRSVTEDGKIAYQRVDFSSDLEEEWRKGDVVLCSILPGTSGCPFPDGTCPQQDSGRASGMREQAFEILSAKGKLECEYQDYRRQDLKLTFTEPAERTGKWIEALILRRLGGGIADRGEDARNVRIDRSWPNHGVELRVVRKAEGKGADGLMTGPIEYIRFRRKTAAPTSAPVSIIPPPQ